MAEKSKQLKLIDPVAIGALVHQACQSFELLERLSDQSVKLSPPFSQVEGFNDLESTCQRALVMHFVVLVARLWRICSRFEDTTAVLFPRDALRSFSAAVKPIVPIRHVNEHGLDPDAWSEFHPVPVTYSIPGFGEFSMVYDERMFRRINGIPLMGNVPLRPIYEATKEFEKIAGFIPAHAVRDELMAKIKSGEIEIPRLND
jgi:hypothetical protein